MEKPFFPRPFLDRFLGLPRPLDRKAYAAIVLRDVEELLNSRLSSPLGDTDEGEEACYGLPDLTLTGRTEGELALLALAVTRCLERYEPRLTGIRVEARAPEAVEIDRVTVRIEAGLAGCAQHPDLTLELPLAVQRRFS